MLYLPSPTNRCLYCDRFFPETFAFFTRRHNRMWHICTECRRAYDRESANRRKDKRHAYDKTYRASHKRYSTPEYKEKMRQRGRRERKEQPEKGRAASRKWRKNNPHKQARACQNWQKQHRERCNELAHIRNARKRGLPSTFTTEDWEFALQYFGFQCAVCGRPAGLFHTLAQDHWIPVSRGGGYTADNIVPLCHNNGGCNNRKLNREPMEWLTSTYGSRKAKQIAKRIERYFERVRH